MTHLAREPGIHDLDRAIFANGLAPFPLLAAENKFKKFAE
jgi:hypothetical protein